VKLPAIFAILLFSSITQAATPQVFFMEPEKTQKEETLPAFRLVTDENKLNTYKKWIDNDAAQWAFDLYSRALKIKHKDTDVYYVALVEGGNHAEVGFKLLSAAGEHFQIRVTSNWIRIQACSKLHCFTKPVT
jgi:hypothetical protein